MKILVLWRAATAIEMFLKIYTDNQISSGQSEALLGEKRVWLHLLSKMVGAKKGPGGHHVTHGHHVGDSDADEALFMQSCCKKGWKGLFVHQCTRPWVLLSLILQPPGWTNLYLHLNEYCFYIGNNKKGWSWVILGKLLSHLSRS